MILRLFHLFFSLFLFTSGLSAQDTSNYKFNNFYDATLSIGASQYAGALSWSHLHGIGKKKQRFKIGYGIRFTSYHGKNQDYITAPAKITSRRQDPLVLFSETFEESLDTVRFSSAQTNSLNAAIYLQYSISKKIDLGFNIDAIGFSFGGSKKGRLISSIQPSNLATEQSAKPTPFNVLLISDNDIGSLNSEFFLRYWISEKVGVKAGFCFLFSEYTTDNKLIFENDRFRNKASMALIGITYSPLKK